MELVASLSQTDEQLKTIKNLLNTKLDLGNKIIELKQELRINELQLMKDNELLELDLIASYKEFISDLKGVEHNRLISLLEDLNKYDGLIWGGSSLNIYSDTVEIRRQLEFMKECQKKIKNIFRMAC